jgi:hypothetical protein
MNNDFPPLPDLPIPLVERLETQVERCLQAFPDPTTYAPVADATRRTIRMVEAIVDARH